MTAGFLDEQYVATGGVLGLMAFSSDGAKTWLQTNSVADCRYGIEVVSPQVIWTCGGATIDTYLAGEGYLLDPNGVLYFTKDDGQHWREAGKLPLGDLTISFSAYQMAAMRFSDKEHGLIVISPGDYGNDGQIIAFHTYDGGETWISESVPVAAGSVYLSRTGGYLTVITAYDQLTLLRYAE